MSTGRFVLGRRALAGAAVSAADLTRGAAAQAPYPGSQPVTIVLPYAAGGLPTVLGNTLTQGLMQRLGGTFVADFRPGGSQTIGTRQVARARPDGHTLLMASVTVFTAVPFAVRNPGFDALTDFDHLTMIGNTLFMLVGHPRWPSLDAFVAEAKRRPGQLTYGTWGVGSTSHIVMVDFMRRAGIELLHIPFGGSGPAITEILGGRLDLLFSTFASAKPHVEGGRLRAFGVPSTQRVTSMPQIPTMIELGYADFTFDAWLSMSAPAGTPQPVLTALETALVDTFAEPETRRRLDALGLEPSPPGAAALRESIRRNLELNRDLMARAGIVPA